MRIVEDRDGNAFEFKPISCPTCGPQGTERIVGMRGGRYHRYGLGVESQIVQCQRCALYYPNPFPIPLNAQQLYADPDKYFESHDSTAKVQSFRRLIRSLSANLGSDVRSLLDVGSGRGEMLAAAQQEGVARIVGLELSTAMIEDSKKRLGVQVLPELIEQHAETRPEPYDAIILNAILEHVMDPDSMIHACRSLLAPQGVLYIDIPNEDHLLAIAGNAFERVRQRPQVYVLSPTFPPFHVFGFNPNSLRTLLFKHGFIIDRLDTVGALNVPAKGGIVDRTLAAGASFASLLSKPLGMGHNMFVWASLGTGRGHFQ